ncbi:MAG: rRNA cytosine-C5-methyltransferase [Bacteroidales bacterium]|nr:rRNA cytosine-C5-methyltransferase [Candidatus Liminaster caballi]
MTLPEAFLNDIKSVLPAAEHDSFVDSLTNTDPSVSIRLNAAKFPSGTPVESVIPAPGAQFSPVPWTSSGHYISQRPQFTLDPLLHAGAYYVQEASSMFITHVLRTFVDTPVTAIDLCAAPGGKSTAALSVLPEGSILVSNEIDRKRSRILAENIQKWGNPNVCVTGNAPAHFSKLREVFDVVIADVPCSGEGMFRKDEGSIAEWNPAKVHECAALQRQILRDIWPCLKPGGLLIYSTCTFNVHEDEEQLQFICDELGASILPIPTQPDWHIHPALCGDFAPGVRPESACRFMPHFTKGEGLFMAALRKNGSSSSSTPLRQKPSRTPKELQHLLSWIDVPASIQVAADGTIRAIPDTLLPLYQALIDQRLFLLHAGIELGTQKGKDLIPAHALALSTALRPDTFPTFDLDLDTALTYLRRDNIILPADTPRGYVLLTYRSTPLGFVKNLGNRTNSLYPTEWRIRNL